MIKKIQFVFVLVFLVQCAYAAPLQGTYTLDSTSATSGTNFQNWQDFSQALLNNGVSAAVVLNVMSDRVEQNSVSFPAISGVSATNTITVNGNGYTLSANLGDAVVLLKGINYLSIDSLRILNTSSSFYAIGVRLSNASSYNTITKCTIEFNNLVNYSAKYAAYIAMAESATSLADSSSTDLGLYNTFSYNKMWTTNANSPGPSYAIVVKGNKTNYKTVAQNTNIVGNLIQNFSDIGIFMLHTNGNLLESNIVTRLSTKADDCAYTLMGIYSEKAYSTSRQNVIRNNYLLNWNRDTSQQFGSIGIMYGITCIDMIGTDARRVLIEGNNILGLRAAKDLTVCYTRNCKNIEILSNVSRNNDVPVTSASGKNFYGFHNSLIGGHYKINGNKIIDCDGGYEWYGIQNVLPQLSAGTKEINDNVIENNGKSNFYTYRIYFYGNSKLDTFGTIHIKGNTIRNNESDYYYTYNIFCFNNGDFKITDNLIEGNETKHYYMYNMYLYQSGNYHLARNVIKNNKNTGIIGYNYGIYAYNNIKMEILSNLIVDNIGVYGTTGIYAYSIDSVNSNYELRQNTVKIDGSMSTYSDHEATALRSLMYRYANTNIIGNIFDVQNSKFADIQVLSNTSLDVSHNTYYVNNVDSQTYTTQFNNGMDSTIDGWIGLNMGIKEFNADSSNGNHFDSSTYASKLFWNQNNVPSVSYNLLDVYGNSRNNQYSDRGAVEYSGPTGIVTFEVPLIKSYVYPNPNATRNIQLNNLNKNTEYHIYNILGEEMMKGKLTSGMNQIDLNFEAKGIIFIRLDKEQAIQVVLR
ncbi:MAG: hypothetical protein R2852_03940 [Bacteroidia bacterium]